MFETTGSQSLSLDKLRLGEVARQNPTEVSAAVSLSRAQPLSLVLAVLQLRFTYMLWDAYLAHLIRKGGENEAEPDGKDEKGSNQGSAAGGSHTVDRLLMGCLSVCVSRYAQDHFETWRDESAAN